MKNINRNILVVCAFWGILIGLGFLRAANAGGRPQDMSCILEPAREIMRLEIIGDASGNIPIRAEEWSHFGSGRGGSGVIFVSRGERYRLQVTNLTGRRLGLVVAVDGRNILTGESSYGRPREGLYILPPFGSGQFTGWRTSLSEVRRFYFTDAEDSYASRLGDPDRIGQITVTAFAEYRPFPPPEVYYPSCRDEKASGRADSSVQRSFEPRGPGTGWGERDYSPVRETDFEPESSPSARYVVRYEWARRHHHHWYPEPEHRDFCPSPGN